MCFHVGYLFLTPGRWYDKSDFSHLSIIEENADLGHLFFSLRENMSRAPTVCSNTGADLPNASPSPLPCFTSPHVKHPLLLLTAHCAQLSAALRLIYGSPRPSPPPLSLPLPRWCNNGGGLLLPSYRGKVEITLTQGLAVSVTEGPRTVQMRFPSFVIRNTIRKKAKRCKNKADKKKKMPLW